MLDAIRDFFYRFQQPQDLRKLSGLIGYCLVSLTTDKMVKNGVAVVGNTYHVYPLDNFVKYDPCAVVGVKDGYLMVVKPFKDRTEIVDLITLINTINTINSLGEITNIKNVESLDSIDEIDLIKRVYLKNVPYLTNCGFETGDFTGWSIVAGYAISDIYVMSGAWSVHETFGFGAYIEQVLEVPVQCKYITQLSVMARGEKVGFPPANSEISFIVKYTDGDSDSHTFTATKGTWTFCDMTPYVDIAKVLRSVRVEPAGSYYEYFLDDFILLSSEPRVITGTKDFDNLTMIHTLSSSQGTLTWDIEGANLAIGSEIDATFTLTLSPTATLGADAFDIQVGE